MELRKATRKKVKLRVALSGPSGSGKTTSALLMAYGITGDWSKIALIDTEHNSAEHYAVSSTLGTTEEDTFNVLELEAPYTPERYIQAIETCEKADDIEVIIIDSASHEWNGKGGILEMKDSIGGKSSFNAWEKVTPEHNKFIEKMLSSTCHVFACFRAKTDYILVDKNGKQVPEKVGLKAITRDEVDYEFSVWFDLDIRNTAEATKDRTELFKGRPDFRITKQTGSAMKAWADAGKTEVQLAIEELRACSDRACTVQVYKKYKHLQSSEQFMAVLKDMDEKYPKEEKAEQTEKKEEPAQKKATEPAKQPSQEAAPANKPGMISEKQKHEIIALVGSEHITRQEKTKALLGINILTSEKAEALIEKLEAIIAENKPTEQERRVPEVLKAEPELIQEIEELLEHPVITEEDFLACHSQLPHLLKLDAREMRDNLKKTIASKTQEVAA